MSQPYDPYQQQPYGNAPGGHGAPAGLGERFLARLIDGVVLLVVSLVIGVVLGGGLVATGGADTDGLNAAASLASLLGVVVNFAYYGFLDSTQGGTLGKKALKLRVVAPDGTSNVSFVESAKRNAFFALGLLGLVPFLGLIGNLLSLAAVIVIAVQISQDTARRQGWHDRFAGGTQVVKVG